MDAALSIVEPDAISQLEPLSALSAERLQELLSLSTRETITANQQIYAEANAVELAVSLLNGEASMTLAGQGGSETIAAGSDEARQSLVGPRFRAAYARTDCTVLRMDSEVLDIMLAWQQLAEAESREAINNSEIDNSKFLNKYHKSFRQIPVANIGRMFALVEPVPYRKGEIVIREGDEGDFFYLLEFGSVRVTRKDESGAEQELARLGEGTSFGEDALLTNNPRNATITMLTDGVLLRLGKEGFLGLLQEPALEWLDPMEAQARVEDGARWLDVRYWTEFRQSRLLDAINFPLQELRERASELDPSLEYITYCNTGRRSSAAAVLLEERGVEVAVLTDGMFGLRQQHPDLDT